jgi:alpha-N-arabinofuranosidase
VNVESKGLIDAAAAWSADRKTLTVAVVNPTMTSAEIPVILRGVSLSGRGTKWQIAGNDPMAYNDPDQPAKVKIEESRVRGASERLKVEPCSVTLFALDVR